MERDLENGNRISQPLNPSQVQVYEVKEYNVKFAIFLLIFVDENHQWTLLSKRIVVINMVFISLCFLYNFFDVVYLGTHNIPVLNMNDFNDDDGNHYCGNRDDLTSYATSTCFAVISLFPNMIAAIGQYIYHLARNSQCVGIFLIPRCNCFGLSASFNLLAFILYFPTFIYMARALGQLENHDGHCHILRTINLASYFYYFCLVSNQVAYWIAFATINICPCGMFCTFCDEIQAGWARAFIHDLRNLELWSPSRR